MKKGLFVMPEISTASGYEKRITEYATTHGKRIEPNKVKRLAAGLCKRQARMLDADLERIFMHSDPTPKKAFRNIENAALAANSTK